jgi:hypothetical protein
LLTTSGSERNAKTTMGTLCSRVEQRGQASASTERTRRRS